MTRRTGPILSGRTGQYMLCCWYDCDRLADYRYEWTIPRPPDNELERYGVTCGRKLTLTYPFCSERHRELYRNSHISQGNLPMGSRGTLL